MSKKCQNCGAEMADNMNFCPKCHAKFEAPAPVKAKMADVPPAVSQAVPPSVSPGDKEKVPTKIIHTINGILGLINLIVFLIAKFALLGDFRLVVLGGAIIFAIQFLIFVLGQSIILFKQPLSVKLTTWAICAVSGVLNCLAFISMLEYYGWQE